MHRVLRQTDSGLEFVVADAWFVRRIIKRSPHKSSDQFLLQDRLFWQLSHARAKK